MNDEIQLTDEEKYELELQTEAQLSRLQRIYAILRREGVKAKRTRQDNVISIYQKEFNNLKVDLNVATSPSKKKVDLIISKSLIDLLNEYDRLEANFRLKKAHMREMDINLGEMKKLRIRLKSLTMSDLKLLEQASQNQRTIEKLENKYEVQITKFCGICYENQKLRDQVDHLLQERVNFNIKWERLIKQLTIGKRFMMDLVEQANLASDKREECNEKLKALREKAYNDYNAEMKEMRILERKEADEVKLGEFFGTKHQKRIMVDLEIAEYEKCILRKETTQKNLEVYNSILNKVQEVTGYKKLVDIINYFQEQETENFGKFKYINEISKEIEILNSNLNELHSQIDEQKALNKIRITKQETNIDELRGELKRVTEAADDAELKLTTTNQNITKIFKGVGEMFHLCNCTNDPLMKLLGEHTEIVWYNIPLYLQIIESTVCNIMVSAHHAEKNLLARRALSNEKRLFIPKEAPKIYSIWQTVPKTPCPLCVEHEQVSEVIETLQKVLLDKKEVATKLKARLKLPDGLLRVHNVSDCHLPKSREIIQKRYQ